MIFRSKALPDKVDATFRIRSATKQKARAISPIKRIGKCSSISLTALSIGLFAAATAHADSDLSMALSASKPIIESSLRLEDVDQQGITKTAQALTLRNRIGVQTGAFHHWSALVEVESTAALVKDYNSSVNGKTQYPGVNDPGVVELNRAQLTWAPDKVTALTLGRQRIILDDARFVGNAGWRQDEQTFDGVRLDTGAGKFKVTAAYLSRINRVIGDEKDWHASSYLLNASYDFGPALKLTAFDYSLRFTTAATRPLAADISNARASSVDIAGARIAGSRKTATGAIGYVAQIASESDGHGNPQDFRLQESMFEINGSYRMWSGRLNYESLGGNGAVGFITPLASPHPFQGFADAFSATGGNKTFVNGIDDLSATVNLSLPGKYKPVFTVVYHDFNTARLNQDLGTEWDAVITAALTPHLNLMLKTADFTRDNPTAPASRRKTWIMLQYKL